MKPSRPIRGVGWASCLGLLTLLLIACDTGVVESPEPGILRVTLQADPADNTFEVLGDMLRIYDEPIVLPTGREVPAYAVFGTDTLAVPSAVSFPLTVSQGRVYRDSLYSILFKTTAGFRAEDFRYEMLRRGDDGQPVRYTLYETLVPPGEYDSLLIAFVPDSVRFRVTRQPVHLADARNPMITFREFPRDGQVQNTFEVFEGQTTEVHLQIAPFESIERFGNPDRYEFGGHIEVSQTNYQR